MAQLCTEIIFCQTYIRGGRPDPKLEFPRLHNKGVAACPNDPANWPAGGIRLSLVSPGSNATRLNPRNSCRAGPPAGRLT